MSQRIISTILSMRNDMTKSLESSAKSVKAMKNELGSAKESIQKFEGTIKNASAALGKSKEKEEAIKRAVLESSQAYKSASSSIKAARDRSEEISRSITKHQESLAGLQKNYNSSKATYESASAALKELKKTFGKNSEEVAAQQKKVADLKKAYNSASGAFKSAKTTISELKAEQRSNAASIKRQASEQEKLRATLLESSPALKKIRKQMKEYSDKIEDAKQAITKTRRKVPELTKSIAKNRKAFEASKKTVKSWGRTLATTIDNAVKKSAKIAMASATIAGGFAIKTGFETAFDLEAYRTQLDTAVKDTKKASKLMAMAQKYSNESPFTSKEVIQSTAMMESYGVSSERYLKVVADMAGATNKEMEQATGALIAAVTKQEFERMEEFGISKKMVMARSSKMFGAGNVFTKGGSMQDGKEEELKAVLESLMTEKFDGGAQKLSKTVKGLWSTITGVTSDSLAKIFGMENGVIKAGSALDILKQQLELVAETLVQWQSDGTLERFAKQFSEAMQTAVAVAKELFAYLRGNKDSIAAFAKYAVYVYGFAKSAIFLGKAISGIRTVFTVVQGLHTFATSATVITRVIKGMAFAFGVVKKVILVVKLAMAALSTVSLPVVAVIAAVAGAAYLLYAHFDTVVGAIKKCWSWFKGLTESMPGWAKILLLPIMPIFAMIDGVKFLIEKLKGLWTWFKGISDAMPGWAKILLLPIAPIFAIVDAVSALIDKVKGGWKWVKGFFGFGEEEEDEEKSEKKKGKSEKEKPKKPKPKNPSPKPDAPGAPSMPTANFATVEKSTMFSEKFEKVNNTSRELVNNTSREKTVEKSGAVKKTYNITFSGDVYGMGDFKDKVKQVMDEVVDFDLQNVT